MLRNKGKSGGFTVIELIVTIAVMAILVTIGIPAIQELIKNNRVTAQSNELTAMINFARNEALRRNDAIPVELSTETNGWSGEVRSPDGQADTQDCTVGVLRCASYDRVELDDNVVLTFNNRGYLVPFNQGTVTVALQHEDCSGDRQRRLVRIRPSGQVEGCTVGCGVTAWQC